MARSGQIFSVVVLTSLVCGSAWSGESHSRTSFTIWRDPQAGAFELAFPAEWTVQGGLGPDTRFGARAVAPDGKTELFLGDPTPGTPADGNPPILPVVHGGDDVKGRLAPAERYAAEFVRQHLCAQPTVRSERNLRETTKTMEQDLAASGASRQFHLASGDVSFRCGAEQEGYVMAVVFQFDRGRWLVPLIVGTLGPSGDQSAAMENVRMMLLTFRFDETWTGANMSEQMAAVWEIIRRTNAAKAKVELGR